MIKYVNDYCNNNWGENIIINNKNNSNIRISKKIDKIKICIKDVQKNISTTRYKSDLSTRSRLLDQVLWKKSRLVFVDPLVVMTWLLQLLQAQLLGWCNMVQMPEEYLPRASFSGNGERSMLNQECRTVDVAIHKSEEKKQIVLIISPKYSCTKPIK